MKWAMKRWSFCVCNIIMYWPTMVLHFTLLCNTDKTKTHVLTIFNKPLCILQKHYHCKIKGTRGSAVSYPLQRHVRNKKSERKRWWRVKGEVEEQEERERFFLGRSLISIIAKRKMALFFFLSKARMPRYLELFVFYNSKLQVHLLADRSVHLSLIYMFNSWR